MVLVIVVSMVVVIDVDEPLNFVVVVVNDVFDVVVVVVVVIGFCLVAYTPVNNGTLIDIDTDIHLRNAATAPCSVGKFV
jgi:hypothetical protein